MQAVDLNEQLIQSRPDSFFMQVNCDAMVDAGIMPGDQVIVDRSIEPGSGRVVVALVGGEMLIRRLDINNSRRRLLPATGRLSPIELCEGAPVQIWGVVTYVIRSL